MTNMVTVVIAASPSPADPVGITAEGNFIFSPNGTQWPGTPGSLPIVPMVQIGHLTNGTGSVQLVATDNFTSNTILAWDIIINIRGLPTVNFPDVPVNFASGATQSVWDILNAAGWVPVSQP
jgi:hypothetical protein